MIPTLLGCLGLGLQGFEGLGLEALGFWAWGFRVYRVSGISIGFRVEGLQCRVHGYLGYYTVLHLLDTALGGSSCRTQRLR